MKRTLTISLLLALAALAVLRFGGSNAPAGEPRHGLRPGEVDSVAVRTEDLVGLAAPPTSVTKDTKEQSADERVDAAATQHVDDLHVRGRLLLPNGSPAVGARVELAIESSATQRFGVEAGFHYDVHDLEPADGKVLAVATDTRGEFELTEGGHSFGARFLRATLDGYTTTCWRLRDIADAAERDLGEQVLEPAGAVRVHLVNETGAALGGRWVVSARSPTLPGRPERVIAALTTEPEPDGSYLLEGLTGELEVAASTSLLRGSPLSASVSVRPGTTTDVTLTCTGPPLECRLVVRPRACGRRLGPELGECVLRLLRDERVVVERRGAALANQDEVLFDNLDPGPYRLELTGPSTIPYVRDGVTLGDSYHVDLEGNAAVRLLVTDAESGASLQSYVVRTRFELEPWPSERVLLPEHTPAPPDGRIAGLLPIAQTLLVDAPGHTRVVVPLKDLAPGETRDVAVALPTGGIVRGRVVNGVDGSPLPHVPVHFVVEDAEGAERDQTEIPGTFRLGARAARTTTDGEGRFEFESLPRGQGTLRAEVHPLYELTLAEVEVASRERAEEHVLVAERLAGWRGCLLLPPGVDRSELSLLVRPVTDAPVEFGFNEREALLTLDAEGRFEATRLLAGTIEVDVCLAYEPGLTLQISSEFEGLFAAHSGFTALVLELPASGVLERDLDLREAWPGDVCVDVHHGATPLLDVQVELRDEEGEVLASAPVGLDGRARLLGPPPGTHRLCLSSLGRSKWRWSVERLIECRAGQTVHTSVDCHVVSGTLTVVDAETGRPFSGRRLYLSQGEGLPLRKLKIDAEGRVDLSTPVGDYGLSRFRRYLAKRTVPLRWTSGGPAPAVVQLP